MAYNQDARPIWVETTLGVDELLLNGFEGTEAVSSPFAFRLQLISLNASIDLKSLLRKSVTICIQLLDDSPRYINGRFRALRQLHRDSTFTYYEAEVVPWLWFLTLSADCRIFQNKSVPDIVEDVFKEQGFTDYAFRLYGSYSPRTYCTQYRETDLNFVSRLLEEEGIFYYFEHTQNKHTLVLSDRNTAFNYTPVQKKVRYEFQASGVQDDDVILTVGQQQQVQTGKVSLRDFNFTTPSLTLEATEQREDLAEVYDYPGRYEAKPEGDRYARIRLEEREVGLKTLGGSSNVRVFTTGYKFDLASHYRSDLNQTYVLTSVYHRATGNNYRSDMGGFTYENSFEAVLFDTPYRPPRTAMKPRVYGSQTATVVGPAGEEIYTDNYGRVKVQFHWDRLGKGDGNDSCWIRVSQPWAGKQWGAISLPRIGHEVIVDFLEGDPDRPIIIGRVYNAEQKVPYSLPGEGTKTTFKTLSSKGGGGFNEFRFEDKKGSEQIFINAERQMDLRTKKDRFETIGQNDNLIVTKDYFDKIGGDRHLHTVGDLNEKVDGTASLHAGMDMQEKVGMKYALDAGMEIHQKAGMNVVIESGLTLTLKAGASFIMLSPAGVTIVGAPLVLINSGGSAGSGSGSSPQAPTDPGEADKADPGEIGKGRAGAPAPKKGKYAVTPVTQHSPAALMMKQAAAAGTPFCDT